MENDKEKFKKISANKIKMIHPNNYRLFYELLEKESEKNDMLKNNLIYIKKALDLMEPMDRKSEEKDIICLVCEGLIKGLDIEQAIEEANSNRLNEYLKLMGKEAFKLPEEQRYKNKEIYRRMVQSDRKNTSEIRGVISDSEVLQEATEYPILTEVQTVSKKPHDKKDNNHYNNNNDKGKKDIRNHFVTQLIKLAKKGNSRKRNTTDDSRIFNGTRKGSRKKFNAMPKTTGIR